MPGLLGSREGVQALQKMSKRGRHADKTDDDHLSEQQEAKVQRCRCRGSMRVVCEEKAGGQSRQAGECRLKSES